jgi:hypothetical protein
MKSIFRSTALAAGFALTALGMIAAPASAATVTATSATVTTADTGFSWTVDFICSTALPCNGGDPGMTLSAQAVFTLTSVAVSATDVMWGINLVVSNNSSVAGFLTAMGFDTDPDATMGSVADSNSDGIVFAGGTGAIPGFGTELCVWDGANCSAANDHSMTQGVSDTMDFVLTALGTGTSLTFDNFAVKVAGAGLQGGSYEFGGTIGEQPPAPVPLPAAGGLLLAGLGGLVVLRRKQKSA